MPASRRLSAHALPRTLASQSASILLLAACLLAPATPSHADQSASAGTSTPEATHAPVAMVRSYLPKPSETLDQVIAHTMPDSPLKIELLRQAFMAQNPQAILPAKVPKLRKGMLLLVPDHSELLRTYLGNRAAVVEATPPVARFTPSTGEERRRWVQFP
jgi:Tfp pilus assembly protein FimV